METKLIYIGDKFYWESRTLMSCLYAEDGERYDWGFVQRDVNQGKTVIIRPATNAEFGMYQKKLDNFREESCKSK